MLRERGGGGGGGWESGLVDWGRRRIEDDRVNAKEQEIGCKGSGAIKVERRTERT